MTDRLFDMLIGFVCGFGTAIVAFILFVAHKVGDVDLEGKSK